MTDAATLSRIKALAIPPAWEDVWICPDPDGHIQAVGTDAAGRRQYRYHDRWRELRDREKFDRVLEFGDAATHGRAERAALHLLTSDKPRNNVGSLSGKTGAKSPRSLPT